MDARLRRRDVLRLGAIGGGAAFLAACGVSTGGPAPATVPNAGQTAAAKAGGALRFGLSGEPGNLDPHVTAACPSVSVYVLVYSNLLMWTPDNKLRGDLADSWKWLDPKTLEVKLRTAKFHDGSLVTADDVAFSFQRILDPATAAYQRAVLAAVLEKVEAVDPKTVRFALKFANNSFPELLADRNVFIISKAYVAAGKDLKAAMMGSGPFRFVSYEKGVALKLERNPDYYLGPANFDTVTIVPMADETARVSALRSGSVDFIDYVPGRDMAALEKSTDFKLYSNSAQVGQRLVFNLKHPTFENAKVRQAFNLAIDRDAYVRAVLLGRGLPVKGSRVVKGHWAYDESLASVYKYDPAAAKKLLADVGYPSGFKVKFLTTSTFGFYKDGATFVQASLKEIGVDAELEILEFPVLVARQTKGQFELLMSFFTGQGPSDHLVAYGAGGPQNFGGFSDDAVTSALQESLATQDDAKRREVYVRAQKRLLDLIPDVPLAWREQGEGASTKVTGYDNLAASICQGKTLAGARFGR